MKKLLQISSTLNKGAIGVIAEHIGILAQQHGYDSYVAHGARYVNRSQLKTIKFGSVFSEKMHALKSFIFDKHGLGSKKQTLALIQEIHRISPDIIHIHNLHGYYINYKVLFEYLSTIEIPIVWTLHDCWSFTGHCAYFDLLGCEKWKNACDNCECIKDYPAALIDNSYNNYILKRFLFSKPKNVTLVPVSNWLNNLLNDSFLSKYPKITIHNGIDLNIFYPCESDIRQKYNIGSRFVILGVANGFGARKGLADFIKLQSLLNDDYKIVLIGVSDTDMKIIPSDIVSIKHTESPKEMAEFYSMSDVFWNPTYEDNYPTTNLEAIACGTPVITYKTGGSPESVTEETGFVLEKGDINAVYEKILKIQESGGISYKSLCRKNAEKFFDMNKCFMEYINLYNRLLGIERGVS